MTLETTDIENTAEICASQRESGKMKLEQSSATPEPPSASADLHGAPSWVDGVNAHPRIVDENTRALGYRKEGAAMTEMNDETSGLRFALDAAARPSVEIDTAKYQAYLDDPALSADQKDEIIHALWSIMMAFVDLGFGVHPAQEVCGKDARGLDVQGDKDSNESKLVDTLKEEFERASDDT